MRRAVLILAFAFALTGPATAMVGGEEAGADLAARVVMVTSSRGSFCSAVVLSRTLLLTAGHCVRAGAEYRVLRFDADRQPLLGEIRAIARHPKFDAGAYDRRAYTVDLALVALPAPLPAGFQPVALPASGEGGMAGARYRVAGFGLSRRGDGKTGGTLREAILMGVPPLSDTQLRLQHAAEIATGACQGDSGGPVLRVSDANGAAIAPVLVGVLASATGGDNTRGCGGRTGVALLKPALDWLKKTAAELDAGQ